MNGRNDGYSDIPHIAKNRCYEVISPNIFVEHIITVRLIGFARSQKLLFYTLGAYKGDIAYRVRLAALPFLLCNYEGDAELASVSLMPYINRRVQSENVFQKFHLK